MRCSSPPELDPSTLLAFLEEDAEEWVETHISICPYCRQRAEALGQTQSALDARLFRATCPPSDELGEYEEGMLSAAQARVIKAHLEECPHCSLELTQLRSFLKSTEIPPAAETGSRVKMILEYRPPGYRPPEYRQCE